MKLSRFCLCLILAICAIFSSTMVAFAEPLDAIAPAKSLVVLEGNTNEVLYHFKKDMQLPIASLTKIVTAIVAIENCEDINTIVEISPKAVGIEGTSIYLKNGESLKFYDLLLGLILASGNDCAIALAEYIGGEGGQERFVEMMNEFILKLELNNSHFDNPHGLDSKTHYSSAYDLACVTAYAMKNKTFREIVATKYATIEGNEIYQTRYLKHKNKLLFSMDSCVGVKTGFTDNAGRCLVNTAEKDGLQVITVILNCGPMFEEAKRLTNNAFSEYAMKEFVAPYNFISNINIVNGDKENIGVVTIGGFKKAVKKINFEKYIVEYDFPKEVKAPIQLNQVIGKVTVKFEDEVIFQDNLYSIDSANNIDLKYLIENILRKWVPN